MISRENVPLCDKMTIQVKISSNTYVLNCFYSRMDVSIGRDYTWGRDF